MMTMILGHFRDTQDNHLVGTVQTLEFSGPIDWRPNADKTSDRDPDLIGFHGDIRLGRAYRRLSRGQPARVYYRAQIDDPSFTNPISGNIVQGQNGAWDFMFSRKAPSSQRQSDASKTNEPVNEADAD